MGAALSTWPVARSRKPGLAAGVLAPDGPTLLVTLLLILLVFSAASFGTTVLAPAAARAGTYTSFNASGLRLNFGAASITTLYWLMSE